MPHPESDADWLDGSSPYAVPFTQAEVDDLWGTHAGDNSDCATCRWLLTLADLGHPGALDSERRAAALRETPA